MNPYKYDDFEHNILGPFYGYEEKPNPRKPISKKQKTKKITRRKMTKASRKINR